MMNSENLDDVGYFLVITTGDDKDQLNQLAAALVEAKLAACAQVMGPIQSHYSWKGQAHCDTEWQCHIKTRRDQFDSIKQQIKRLHHYDLPEMIALEISDASQEYLKWIDESLKG